MSVERLVVELNAIYIFSERIEIDFGPSNLHLVLRSNSTFVFGIMRLWNYRSVTSGVKRIHHLACGKNDSVN